MSKPISFCALIVAALLAGCSPGDKQPREARPADQAVTTPATVAQQREEAAKPEPAPMAVAPLPMVAAPPPPARSRAQPVAEAKLAASSSAQANLASHTQELESLRAPSEPTDREQYAQIEENPIKRAAEQPVSTFSIDVDTGSYANVRRFLNAGRLPPHDAVRVEELINYFDYDYPPPESRQPPFQVSTELAPTPWNPKTLLLAVGIKGYELPKTKLPPANLVFLIDVSGSMSSPDKLDLLKPALKLLVRQLRPEDRGSHRGLRRRGGHGAGAHVGQPESEDRSGAGPPGRRRFHQRWRRYPTRLQPGPRRLRRRRCQPGHSGHRRRFQRRYGQLRGAEESGRAHSARAASP